MQVEKSFGEAIKQLREARSLTLRVVAADLGIGTSMLGKIEKNNRIPNTKILDKLARYYEVEIKALKVCLLSDKVVKNIYKEEFAIDAIRVAEQKIKYISERE